MPQATATQTLQSPAKLLPPADPEREKLPCGLTDPLAASARVFPRDRESTSKEQVDDLLARIGKGDAGLRLFDAESDLSDFQAYHRARRFRADMVGTLRHLARHRLGFDLIDEVTSHHHAVTLRPMGAIQNAWVIADDTQAAQTQGKGSPSEIHYPWMLDDQDIKLSNIAGDPIDNPRHVTLAHELIHAYRAQRGRLIARAPTHDAWHAAEEWHTITGPHRFTENRIRTVEGLQMRYGHISAPSKEAPRPRWKRIFGVK